MQRGFARKRGNTWTAYYYVTIGGRRRQRSTGGFRTKRAALTHLNEVMSSIQRDDFVEPAKLTLAEYLLERWLPTVERTLRPSTFSSYTRVLGLHVIPTLGDVPLQSLTIDHVDQLYARLLREGRHDGTGGLSPKSVRYIHTTLHRALRDAERKRLVNRNVTEAADPPKVRQHGDQTLHTWTAPQVRQFLLGMREHRLYAAYHLAATTGMRRGEVLGLRWEDIDFAERRLAVRQTVLTVDYKIVLGTPKTARGRRSVALDPETVAALQRHRRLQAQERERLGNSTVNHDLVFARETGAPVHPDYFSQCFDRSVKRLALPKIRLHDLRHTHATLGLAAGVPAKVMSDRLGHATVAFTQDVYMHAIPQLEYSAADLVANLIFADGRPKTRREPNSRIA